MYVCIYIKINCFKTQIKYIFSSILLINDPGIRFQFRYKRNISFYRKGKVGTLFAHMLFSVYHLVKWFLYNVLIILFSSFILFYLFRTCMYIPNKNIYLFRYVYAMSYVCIYLRFCEVYILVA